jgi:hypothetical protein
MTLKIERDLHGSSKVSLAAMMKKLAKTKSLPASNTEMPRIPAPALFEFLLGQQQASGPDNDLLLPTISDCAAHLELLESLYTLRQRVLQSTKLDAVFGIQEHRHTVVRKGKTVRLRDATLSDRRQPKWKCFVEWSVVRFLLWRRNVHVWCSSEKQDWGFTQRTLPPLDVLMVLHSFLLNPSLFQRHCEQGPLRDVRFPWALVHKALAGSSGLWGLSVEATACCGGWLDMKVDLLEDMDGWRWNVDIRKPLIDFTHEGDTPYPPVPNIWIPPSHKPSLFVRSERALGAQLVAAVLRQSDFIEKMNFKLWIRSPAVGDTLERAVARYEQFLQLIRVYRDVTLVPTLDIDLVWHTHQCSPTVYRRATRQLVGRFVDHNDSLGNDALATGFQKTRELYLVRFGSEYRVCGCWDCEALLSAIRASEGSLPNDEALQKVSDMVTRYKAVELVRRKENSLFDRGQWAIAHGNRH